MLLRELERELVRLDNWLDPFREFNRVDRELQTIYPARAEFPLVNIRRNEEKAVVTAEIPGVTSEGIEISVAGKTLTISFERKPEELKEEESYTRKERRHGEFCRTVELPFVVEPDKVEARLRNGVLYVELPRAEAEKPRKISVNSE